MENLFTRCVLRVTVPEATNRYQYDQLCDGMKVGFDGAVHGVQYNWDTKLTMEYWGFILTDSKNAFDNIN